MENDNDNPHDVETYDNDADFQAAAKSAWENYLLNLADDEEPKHNMMFYGVVKSPGGFVVACARFNPRQEN